MPREFKITNAQHGAAFAVRVVTRADEIQIAGVQDDGSLKIRLTEVGRRRPGKRAVDRLPRKILEVAAGADRDCGR